ncbi:MAG: phosphomannomutase/phosphoglucomutase [Planctomycetes bacterium]|jgi:phosphomannomutase|nr:phosphomannomutase/phosphoglucomutase [Planctomycetota bacterium]MBT4028576.1 phosphomannomutase/phosphoglucomutase [Planctomycetota bacterium]MBT4559468.1 phosphomannomutase/phosphoglucomutase [Planctomycetota bacterium]MBT5101362.1 phosphomannomutase/phosphoglucomutase [Planctomycetota bacterium]MBT7319005.1 phosphomannomutase/phosphoglucomutase [Planctomycetota bacterium]
MSVFKAYDIRGTWPDQIDSQLSYRIGRAYADFLGEGPIVVGRDMRTMAPEAQAECIRGILDGGLDVIDVGLTATPQLYFAIGHLGAAGGLNVTASHNPKQYIGFKLCEEEAKPISADNGIKEIEVLATAPDCPEPVAEPGSLTQLDTLADYVLHVKKWADLARPVKIVSDAANGMAAHTFPAVLDAMPDVEHEGLFYELDGTFPNHEANPLKLSTLVDLQKLVIESGAELGAAFDGDCDRCCFVDDLGRAIGNDIVTTLVAREVLKEEPGAAIVYDLRSSWILPQTILAGGGKPVKERVGHSFLKGRMREFDAPFGGELSGHYYARDNWYADNAEIILMTVMGILSRTEKKFSELCDEVMVYHSTGEVNFHIEDKVGAMDKLKAEFADAEIDELDGVTIAYGAVTSPGWWWVNLRASNTEPLLRMNLESDDRAKMEEMTTRVIDIIGVQPEA